MGFIPLHADKVSSTVKERKSLNKLWDFVREGDTIVVWKLDRLARSLIHFTKLMNELEGKGVRFKSRPYPGQGIGSPSGPEQKEQTKSGTLRGIFQGGNNDRYGNLRKVEDFKGYLL